MSVSLVTAILLQRGGPTLTPVERYLDLVDHIVRTGLPLTLFLDEAFRGRNFPAHVTVHHLTIRDLWLCKVIDAIGHDKIHIPAVRYEIKDTLDYLIIQNSKNELTARVDADRVAWIDAGVAKMSPTFERLQRISELPDGITIPGRADYSDRRPALIDDIMWRFCGSFFSGDRASIARFDVEHRKMILRLLPALTWDVNTWAHVEEAGFPFHWYSAGHNDSLLNFPIGEVHEQAVARSDQVPG